MNHAASQDFHPASVLTNTATFAATDKTAYIHFRTGFSKRKIRRPETHFCILAKHFLHKEIECLLQVSKAYIFINIQSFDLVKEAMGAGRNGFIAVNAAGTNDP